MEKDTSLRLLVMLRMVPREPFSITADLLLDKLNDQGYDIGLRTVQRDLNRCSIKFPLVTSEGEGKQLRWSWEHDSDVMDIPDMSPYTALTFNLAEHFVAPMLPPKLVSQLNPHFNRAKSLLSKLNGTGWKTWSNKIRHIPRGLTLKPAEINPAILETLYAALLQDRQFEAEYQKKGAEEIKTYLVHPLGLVFRHEIAYLVCTVKDYQKPIQLAVHRIQKAELLEEKANKPENFKLDDYINKAMFSYPVGEEEINLKVRFFGPAILHLFETPLSGDQTIIKESDASHILQARVQNTSELQWWLLAFGDQVEVIEPQSLRETMKEVLKKSFQHYAT
ncbi:MAG: WYL domain-containing protein [SAR324 cluster bacterium]|nr:WYL domain-containing protein [SAR324 cluster bacterium]